MAKAPKPKEDPKPALAPAGPPTQPVAPSAEPVEDKPEPRPEPKASADGTIEAQVSDPLRIGGKLRKVGATVTLSAEEFEELSRLGVVTAGPPNEA